MEIATSIYAAERDSSNNVFVSSLGRTRILAFFSRDFVRVEHFLDVARECWKCSHAF